MFSRRSVKDLRRLCKADWKSCWDSKDRCAYKAQLYLDLFVRRYVASFLSKWSKFGVSKVLGSVYLVRTFGKLCVQVYFFYPLGVRRGN